MTLTTTQRVVADELLSKLGSHSVTLLSGAGGTGKTFTLTRAFDGYKVLYLAPTHAAVDVLKGMGSEADTFKTCHSVTGWFPTGFRKVSLDVFNTHDVVVVDESSMLEERMTNKLIELCQLSNTPLIFSGDHCQLPSVEDNFNVFDMEYPMLELSENMRFANTSGGIAKVAETMRHKINNGVNAAFRIPDLDEWTDVTTLSITQWRSSIKEAYLNDADFVVLAADHESLRQVRKLIAGDAYLFSAGQVVRCLDTHSKFKNGQQDVVAEASEPFEELHDWALKSDRIYAARPKWLPLEEWGSGLVAFNYQTVVFESGETVKVPADALTATKMKNLSKKLNRKAVKTKQFDLSCLATVHSSQGRSFDTVYIHTSSVLVRAGLYKMHGAGRNHNRLVYVACSRARNELILVQY